MSINVPYSLNFCKNPCLMLSISVLLCTINVPNILSFHSINFIFVLLSADDHNYLLHYWSHLLWTSLSPKGHPWWQICVLIHLLFLCSNLLHFAKANSTGILDPLLFHLFPEFCLCYPQSCFILSSSVFPSLLSFSLLPPDILRFPFS